MSCLLCRQDDKPRKVFLLDGCTIAVRVRTSLHCLPDCRVGCQLGGCWRREPRKTARCARGNAIVTVLLCVFGPLTQVLDEKSAKKQPNAFRVTTRSGREIYLASEQKQEMDAVSVGLWRCAASGCVLRFFTQRSADAMCVAGGACSRARV